ncbi:Asp23/Gls24 family envelope stress response protein [Streptomyces avicenniae]|uniref:Asp23/Gls24 family envelope stress response protein n=1 Tax=Streptomyces avicenniae TaxID=500153 RepID=UPI000A7DC8F3|nr:Asp23/Gls24 family envelope stress response protein [Streptomyces avicenniae]
MTDPGTGTTGTTGLPDDPVSPDDPVRPGTCAPGDRGHTVIADGVVAKIAGMAARDVLGVHTLGGGLARTLDAVRERVPGGGRSVTRGIKAEVGEVQAALDLEIVAEYGVSLAEVSRTVRENVVAAVERMTGLEVVEVNITIGDVWVPDDDVDEEERPALQ